MIDIVKLNNLDTARVLVVGDVMLDRYFSGDSQRISPEAPVPVVQVNRITDKAGGAANVARNIAHLGGCIGLLGITGVDSEGKILQQMLAKDGVRTHFVTQNELPTITKMRVISRQQQVVRLDLEEAFTSQHSEALVSKLEPLLQDYNFIVFSDYNKGSLGAIRTMIELATQAGKPVLVDPKQADLSIYRGADLVTPNVSEFKLAGGDLTCEESIRSSARSILQQTGIGAMLLTRSEQGMSLITADNDFHFPAQVLEVSDVTGAGDTVIATLATMLSAGMQLPQAVELANIAAGIVVGKRGTSTVTLSELMEQTNHHLFRQLGANQAYYTAPNTPAEIKTTLQQIKFAQDKGEKIVFTNGCFDILHAGHVRYLAEAKALGHRLVVGLNTDSSVARLKGATRPINSQQDRAAVLASLASVDWVIPFGDHPSEKDTPLELIHAVSPNILVKGGDYKVESIVGANEVLAAGGQVRVLNFVPGRSTSAIIERANKRVHYATR